MKLTSLFILWSFFCCAQKVENSVLQVRYLTKFLTDSANADSMKEEITVLLIGKDASLFQSEAMARKDSAMHAIVDAGIQNAANGVVAVNFRGLPKAFFKPQVFKNKENTLIYDELLAEVYAFPAPKEIKWTIGNETKEIAGLSCKKATTQYGNREITAWFAHEIPFSEGPYTFKGLPGLIAETYDNKGHFHFLLVELKNIQKPVTAKEGAVSTTFEKFAKARKTYLDDPVPYLRSKSFFRNLSKEKMDAAVARIKKVNNFLD